LSVRAAKSINIALVWLHVGHMLFCMTNICAAALIEAMEGAVGVTMQCSAVVTYGVCAGVPSGV